MYYICITFAKEKMHVQNIGECNICDRFKTLDIVKLWLYPKITHLYHTWFVSVKKAKYIPGAIADLI